MNFQVTYINGYLLFFDGNTIVRVYTVNAEDVARCIKAWIDLSKEDFDIRYMPEILA